MRLPIPPLGHSPLPTTHHPLLTTHYSLLPPAIAHGGDAVDGAEECLGTGLDAVGRNSAAAVGTAVVFHLHHHLALCVFADRHAMHAEILAHDRDAGEFLDRQEDRVDRSVAAGLGGGDDLIAVAEP